MDQQLIIWAIPLGSFALIVFLMLQGGKDPAAKRLLQLKKTEPSVRVNRSNPATATSPRLAASQTVRDLEQNQSRQKLRARIVQAGLYKPNALNVFLAMRLILCLAPIGIGLLLSSSGVVTGTQGLAFGAIAGLFGTLAPTFWLDRLKRDRQTKIRRALPDALDVIVVCLEAGLSVSAALSRVARELGGAHPMLALELGIVEREVQMGRTTGHAMREFGQRCDLEEIRSLAAVINQAEQFGTSVVKAFTVYAETMRLRRHQRAEESAQKAGVKILFPTLLCIFPGIFIVVLGPAAINIYHVIVVGIKHGHL